MCTLIRSYVTNMTHFTAVGDMVMMWIVYRPQRPSLIISSYRSLVCCSHWPICRPTNRIRCRPDKKKLSADMSVDKNVSGDMSTDKSALLLQSFSMSMFTAIYTSADCRTAFFYVGRQIGPSNWPDRNFCRPMQKKNVCVAPYLSTCHNFKAYIIVAVNRLT